MRRRAPEWMVAALQATRVFALIASVGGVAGIGGAGCHRAKPGSTPPAPVAPIGATATGGHHRRPAPPPLDVPARPHVDPLGPNEAYVYESGAAGTGGAVGTGGAAGVATARKIAVADGQAAGLLVVDLGDEWAPFIFQDGGQTPGDAPKPNGYRHTFVDLAREHINADGQQLAPGEHNFLEPFGIPPTLSVLAARVEDDIAPARRSCVAAVDIEGLREFAGNVGYVDRDRARRDLAEAARDGDWLAGEIAAREAATRAGGIGDASGTNTNTNTGKDKGKGTATAAAAAAAATVGTTASNAKKTATPTATWKPGDRVAAIAALRSDANPRVRARVDRTLRGQQRVRAIRAAQARLVCDGLLSPRAHFTNGSFDLPTHEALAAWERKNDIFGWGFLGGETLAALARPPEDLDLETFRRVLAERVADAAGIVEDGSAAKLPAVAPTPASASASGGASGSTARAPTTGAPPPAPNLIADHVAALLASIHVGSPAELAAFLRQHAPAGLATLRVAFRAPPLPPYYAEPMQLSAEIDRGDVWYDFPFDAKGRMVEQPRDHYPHLTLFVTWHDQLIPLCRWRTTIGSWRSELHENGKIYYRYKNSDVGPRVWKHIVAGPVWIPPDSTPVRDLLVKKLLDRNKGPEWVVNTDVMGPGFQSAYGLVLAIHINRGGFDNQIRTHGSVDYTSIARRFSHGCHRLVNDRAVRLFDFVLRHQAFKRIGSMPLNLKRRFTVDGKPYEFGLATRGYYYELAHPVPINVTEGRVMGRVKQPITAYLHKAGVDYSAVSVDTAAGSDADTSTNAKEIGGTSDAPPTEPDETPSTIGP